jgi:amino acid adenylation domain-containing protein
MSVGDGRERPLGVIVESHAARDPRAPAVEFGSEHLTYGALNRRANQLARQLHAAGAGPGSLVATLLDRSADMIVAWLAIVKAGAAYVPLDPDYPRERLRFMVEDSGALAAITTSRHRPLLPEGPLTICVDEDRDAIASHDDGNLASEMTGAWLAHVIYTSGSTGRPKGVCVPHRAVSRLVLDTTDFTLHCTDRITQGANASFDAATFEVWGALLNGACLVGVPRDIVLSPTALGRFICERRLSVVFLTTALFNLVSSSDPAAFAGVRVVFTGGEAMNARAARDVLAAGAPGQLVNAYGPTENGVYTTVHVVREVAADAVTVPIGRAVNHTDVHLLDDELRPVAPGMPGELCTGGDGLADGYWRLPDLTASRFVPHPFSDAPGARLYRTGDRGRRTPDGSLEFLGRVDEQVKLRGHRVEPGEIESVLLEHPAVAQALVVVREDRPGEKRLVAYVSPTGAARPGASELRACLADRLPSYMLPSALVVVPAMPLTAAGKIDRAALPQPAESRACAAAYVAPRTPIEETLAAFWASLTGIPDAGIHDDFFELGGHSLLAAQVVTRINERFSLGLPLNAIFESPTVALMTERVAAAQRETGDAAPVVKAPRGGPLPLSYTQEQVWFLNELEPGNLAYNFQALIRFRGRLDVGALHRTLEEIVRRHESLRTAFVADGDRPAQHIVAPLHVELPVIDLRHLAEAERRAAADRYVDDQCRRPFDLACPPLARWALVRTADDEHVLIHVEHHLVHDGWSFSVLLRELKTIYQAFSRHEPSPLPEPVWQFADYAVWQRETLTGEVLDGQIAFWRRQLAGAPATLDVPPDRPRPERMTFRGGCERFDLPTDLYAALRAFSRREKVTLFMTMAAAFKTLLWKYTGQDDLVIGSGMANRTRREFESVIGMFVNPVVMRTDLSGNPTFRELVRRVRDVATASYAHQDTPFGKLVEALQPQRDASRNPLFQVLFSFHDAAVPDLTFDEVTATIVERANGSAKFDLNVICIPRAEQRAGDGCASEDLGLTVLWEFNADLFEPATMARMCGEYQNLLRVAVAEPTRRLSDLRLLSPRDRARLLEASNVTPASPVPARPIHEQFEAQVQRTPGAIAIQFEGERLTYADLNRRANQLAHHLRRAGAGPEGLVGLLVERSIEMVVGILGILKAGAAYVPIDPEYPAERIAFMLGDAGMSQLVAEPHLAAPLPSHGVTIVDPRAPEIAAELTHDPVSGATADTVAYVIYTSGSTGTPKGTLVTHANVSRLFTTTDAWYRFGPADVWTLFHSCAFDFSVWELWGALWYGGRLIVIPRLMARSPADFHALVCREGVTILNQTPTAFRQFITAQAQSRDGHQLRHVIFGGEALEVSMLAPWYADARNSHTRLVNMYGITETTVHVTYRPLDPADVTKRQGSPIGGRIADLRLYILDAFGEPVPRGVIGELYVGGAGVARGYLNRPDLTAERFLPDPFSGEPGARLYRTGDCGRWLAGGEIEFHGRNDFQVKIRGFRIELGEIEAQLAVQPGVRDAVVIARPDATGDPQLVAYYTADARVAAAVATDDLRHAIARTLPPHMVPAAIVRLDALPLTPHGKLDRRALPAPDFARASSDYVAPRSDLEAQIADIWKQVLGVERVGATDYFFDLGGHSLKTVQIRSRLSQEFGVDMPLRAAFERPTVEQQAELLSSLGAGAHDQTPSVAIPRLPDAEHYPLSRAQRRLWFLHRLDPSGGFYNRALRIALRGTLDRDALERAIARLADRHHALRTSFHVIDGEPVQSIERGFRPPVEFHDLSAHRPEMREHALRELLTRTEGVPFSLATPPFRVVLCRLEAHRHVVVLVLHHIATDGWSGQVLLDDFAALYGAERDGTPPLPALPLRYVDYAAWDDARVTSEACREDEAYWLQRFETECPRLEWPNDGSAAADDPGARVEIVECDAAEAARLDSLAQQCGVTPFMLRIGMLQAFLARWTGQTDVLIGAPSAGRPHDDMQRLVGFFANTLALRTDLSGDPTFAGVLDRVRRTALDAYEHEAYPFDVLIERLNPVRDADRLPLVQVLFTTEPPAETRDGGGLTFETLPDLAIELAIAGGAAARVGKTELTVSCTERSTGGLAWAFLLERSRTSAGAAKRLADGFRAFIGAVIERPDRRISELPVLSDAERRQVLLDWNAAQSPFEIACVHDLIAAQARRTPDAIAVRCGSDVLSYGDLDRRANWLAHQLRDLGVGPDTLVGLYLGRTPDLVVALLATWKAGGAYLPLDPKYPRARTLWTVADAGATVILADRTRRDDLPADVPVCPVDAVWRQPNAVAERAPETGVTPHHRAYVIYTSGSTGTAKGVDIDHANVCALLHASRELFSRDEMQGVVASTSICFDLSVFEILNPLTQGGTAILVESALHIGELRPDAGVTMVNTVPSAMAEIVRQGGLPPSTRVVNLGGEPLQNALVQQIYETLPSARVFNLYGPTETTTYSTVAFIAPRAAGTPPIGKAVANTRLYVLDARLAPVPIGAVGELYIGGAGVTRGYHKRPDLTAERFIPDPFGPPGSRLYRTGDRVRYREDGSLDFLGRGDDQVKLRGFRIEPGEIAAVLTQHPWVREAVVVVTEDATNDKCLVAYVVPRDGAVSASGADEPAALERALHEHLSSRLPAFMLPRAIVPLKVMPRQPNGKVNRAALPAPSVTIQDERVEPRTNLERDIAQIWGDVFGSGPISIDDNVFELGAHSLMAAKVHQRVQDALVARWAETAGDAPPAVASLIVKTVREAVAREFPLRRVFDYPTVRTLAASVSEAPDPR